MKATKLFHLSTERAPSEWRDIPEIKEQKPGPIGQEVSLQKPDRFKNICYWMVNKGGGWVIASDIFYVY